MRCSSTGCFSRALDNEGVWVHYLFIVGPEPHHELPIKATV
jgi:hypothetical protein